MKVAEFPFEIYFEHCSNNYVFYHDINKIMEENGFQNQKSKREFCEILLKKFGSYRKARFYKPEPNIYYNRMAYYNIKLKNREYHDYN